MRSLREAPSWVATGSDFLQTRYLSVSASLAIRVDQVVEMTAKIGIPTMSVTLNIVPAGKSAKTSRFSNDAVSKQGEVVSAEQAAERSAAYHNMEEQPHTYFMNLSPLEIIDATRKGNRARFINHSCQPNCETQKWLIDGETSICIFALRDIAVGEELTYNYHLQWGGGKRIRCQCGAAKCQGYLEADSAQNRAALLMDTDSGLDDAGDDAGNSFMDPCLETYDSDQDAPFESAGMGSAQLSQSLLGHQAAPAPGTYHPFGTSSYQAGIDATMLRSGRQSVHSPDVSATLTGSGPCSDASDLTSSHLSDLPKRHPKRIKLGSTQAAQATDMRHASVQHALDPNPDAWSSAAEAVAQQQPRQQNLPPAWGSPGLPPRAVLFPASLSPQVPLEKLPRQAVDQGDGPPYIACVVPGLTAAQELVKAEQEAQLAEQLRRQQNMFVAGYEMDDFGGLQLPRSKYTPVLPMKIVFAQRWQREAQATMPAGAASLSAKQHDVVQLGRQQALDRAQPGAAALHGQSGAYATHAKLPLRFKLAEVKNAMRKAEQGGPEMSTTSGGICTPTASELRHTAWQVDQLSNTPILNNLWVEYYIDRFDKDFDDSYWSMLENLSAGSQ
ncbi:hypothetical protein ABBQ38_004116 [Trebouxia sp. C0009 RCD-2024]